MLLKKLLGEILSEMGFVTKQNLEEALTKQREMHNEEVLPERLQRTRLISEARLATNTTPALGKILVDMGVTTKDQLDQAMRKQENLTEVYKSLESEKLGAVVEKCSIINSTLNIYRISNNNTENILYKPINIDFSNNVHSLKKRKALKKMRFFKKRRSSKLKRIRKKLSFFKERRRKKFIKRGRRDGIGSYKSLSCSCG